MNLCLNLNALLLFTGSPLAIVDTMLITIPPCCLHSCRLWGRTEDWPLGQSTQRDDLIQPAVDAAHLSMHARGCILMFLGVAGAFRATTRYLPPSCLAYKIPAQHAVVAGVVNYKSARPDICFGVASVAVYK